MDNLITEHFVHQCGSLPLHLEHDEMWAESEAWFKELVAYVRLEYSKVLEGVWDINDTDSIITCITDVEKISTSRLSPHLSDMEIALRKLKKDSYLMTFLQNVVDGELGDAADTLGEWVTISIDTLLFEVTELMPEKYHNGEWVAIVVGLIFTPINSIVQYKLEYRGKSDPIPARTALATFIDECLVVAKYWGEHADTKEKAADGAVFSMLSLLDGCKMEMPLMDVVLRPHPEDKPYRISEGEDYYIDGQVINEEVMLHDEYCAAKDV